LNLLLLAQGLHVKYTRPTHPVLGASVKKTDDGWQIERVNTGSMAQRAGLAPQDILVSINRHKITQKPDEMLREWKHMSNLVTHYWRDDVLYASSLENKIMPSQRGTYQIERTGKPSTSTWPQSTPHINLDEK
jgi:predicted metalloprotease with PDZ domain